ITNIGATAEELVASGLARGGDDAVDGNCGGAGALATWLGLLGRDELVGIAKERRIKTTSGAGVEQLRSKLVEFSRSQLTLSSAGGVQTAEAALLRRVKSLVDFDSYFDALRAEATVRELAAEAFAPVPLSAKTTQAGDSGPKAKAQAELLVACEAGLADLRRELECQEVGHITGIPWLNSFTVGHRGSWHDELAKALEQTKDLAGAFAACEVGLEDPTVRTGTRRAIETRIERLARRLSKRVAFHFSETRGGRVADRTIL
ncbi:hypothetical protein HK405_012988, partial [Cladochytrium tenue]